MGFFENLFGIFKRKEIIDLSQEELIDAGACPNCWGHQEYQDKLLNIKKIKLSQISITINSIKKHLSNNLLRQILL